MFKIKEHHFWLIVTFCLLISFSITTKKFSFASSNEENLKSILIKNDCIKKALFTSKHNIQEILCNLIINEKKSIKIAMYLLTDKNIANAIIQAKKENNIDIELITCATNLENNNSKIWQLYENDIKIFIFDAPKKTKKKSRSRYAPIMHNKFLIFENNLDNKSILVTGSFNCTVSAQANNKENVIVLEDKDLIVDFISEFEDIKASSRAIMNYLYKRPS